MPAACSAHTEYETTSLIRANIPSKLASLQSNNVRGV